MNRVRGISTAGLAAVLLGLFALPSCESNPYKVQTWVDKLDDSQNLEDTVTQIEHLGDPAAIEPLGHAWEKQGCPQRILQVMIDLSRPLTGEEADRANLVDFAKTGRKASWDKTLPFLKEAIKKIDPDDKNAPKCGLDESTARSIENAGKAADALGEMQAPEALDALIEAAGQTYSRPTQKGQASPQAARLAVILALGKYSDAKAVGALTTLLRNDPEDEPVAIITAAVDSLQQMHQPSAVPILIETMYRVPVGPVFEKVRLALVSAGPPVVEKMRKILRDEDDEVKKLFADHKLDQYCGDRDPQTGKIEKPLPKCQPISIRTFYAAVILGDMYDPSAAPDLLAALKKEQPLPVGYNRGQPTPNTQFNAILDALRKIGAPDGEAQLKAMWNDPKGDPNLRALAIDSYPFVARTGVPTTELAKIVGDNSEQADVGLRLEATATLARLGTSEADVNVLLAQANYYQKKADDLRAKATPFKKTYDDANAKLKAAQDKLKSAKDELARHGGFKSASADLINAVTDAQKEVDAADLAFDNARDGTKEDGTDGFKHWDDQSKANRQAQRTFEGHVARIEIYLHCGKDPACYAKALDAKQDEVIARVSKYVPSLRNTSGDDVWGDNDKKLLVSAEIERAMIELGKLGSQATGQTEALLDHAKSEDVLTRQSIGLALPKIAPRPCPDCVTKLDAAIKAGAGNSALTDLTKQTQVLRLYFSSLK